MEGASTLASAAQYRREYKTSLHNEWHIDNTGVHSFLSNFNDNMSSKKISDKHEIHNKDPFNSKEETKAPLRLTCAPIS